VKRYYADDSAATSVKVGYRQASYKEKPQAEMPGVFSVWQSENPPASLDALNIAPGADGGFFVCVFSHVAVAK
jgi:hypothetical protein